jgi:hypothetical protein
MPARSTCPWDVFSIRFRCMRLSSPFHARHASLMPPAWTPHGPHMDPIAIFSFRQIAIQPRALGGSSRGPGLLNELSFV